jgi:hypothetical protein
MVSDWICTFSLAVEKLHSAMKNCLLPYKDYRKGGEFHLYRRDTGKLRLVAARTTME